MVLDTTIFVPTSQGAAFNEIPEYIRQRLTYSKGSAADAATGALTALDDIFYHAPESFVNGGFADANASGVVALKRISGALMRPV